MLNFVTVDHMTPYPMMDNYVQVNVGNAADKVLPAVLANQDNAARGAAEHGSGVAATPRSTTQLDEDFAG